jgi:glycosyltransferase involved in cell wall biosynthesis
MDIALKKTDKSEICLVTPWPPQHSGIADYSYSLAVALVGSGCKVTVVTNSHDPVQLEGCDIKSVNSESELMKILDGTVLPIFQLGNHPEFHGYMLNAIECMGADCLIELHDVALHHLIMGLTGDRSRNSVYSNWLQKSYGLEVSSQFENNNSFSFDDLASVDILTYPCSDQIVSECAGVIVHSQFAKDVLINAGVSTPIWVVDLCEATDVLLSEKRISVNGELKIGIFGGVQANRKIDAVIEAVSSLSLDALSKISLDIYGSVDLDCQYIVENLKDSEFCKKIKFHGRVSENEFRKAFSSIDLCISLRSPSVGETSAVVSRALAVGLPTVVSNTGWYAELPHFVPKINNSNIKSELALLLERLILDSDLYSKVRKLSIEHARSLGGMRTLVDDLVSIRLGVMALN